MFVDCDFLFRKDIAGLLDYRDPSKALYCVKHDYVPKETVKMDDGRELPLYKLDTSSESHPFYTGTQKSVDNMGGRVERFRNKYGKTAAK